MARYSNHNQNTKQIYKVAEDFRDGCLLGNGSLLFDGAEIWSLENLRRLHEAFVAKPDEGERTFLEKFKDQLLSEERDVCRLAAEMLCVYFLFSNSVSKTRKREVVNEVLAWKGDTLLEDHLVSKAFSCGIGGTGYGYNTRRPFELAFLIEFTIAWKELSPEQQSEKAGDPWSLQELVDQIEDAPSRQLRHILLHLLFPDSFERMASGSHKQRIIKAFSGLLEAEPADGDRAILAIREKLQGLLPDKKQLDFYESPLAQAWQDDNWGDFENSPLELIQHKKQIVLYGPPGTGKTYRAKKLAEMIIRSQALAKLGAARYFQSQETSVADALRDNVHRLQLHPAYSYEDFIRALHISQDGATEYRLGYLPQLIEKIEKTPREERLPHVLILDEMNRTDLSRMLGECFSLLEDRTETVSLPAHGKDGAPMKLSIPDDLYVIGTMNLIDQSVEQLDFALRRRFLWLLCPFDKDALVGAAEAKWNELNSHLSWERVAPDFRTLAETTEVLNEKIRTSKLLGEQYEIGHTYLLDTVTFLHNSLEGRKFKTNFLWNGKGEALEPVRQVWNLSLRPLLEQYLAGLDATERKQELEKLEKTFFKAAPLE